MGKDSNIQWTGNTVNFWHGCKKVSQGCKYCYMYRDKARWHQDGSKIVRSSPATFNAALKWPEPTKIFTCSYSDFFIEDADQWRAEAWEIIRKTPHHTWQILTKRPERIKQCLPDDWEDGYPNVWLGVSVENQKTADDRIPELLKIPANIRFISAEPLLDCVNLKLHHSGIHWVIVGGESGHGSVPKDKNVQYGYRICKPQWIDQIVNQCKTAKVPCFVKQLGTGMAKLFELSDRHGGDIDEWPSFQVRQFPDQSLISIKHILMFYRLGWNEADKKQKQKINFKETIFEAAYSVGKSDFIAGDDIGGIDIQSEMQIYRNIKSVHKAMINN